MSDIYWQECCGNTGYACVVILKLSITNYCRLNAKLCVRSDENYTSGGNLRLPIRFCFDLRCSV